MAYMAMTSAANPAPAIAIATMKATTLPFMVAFVRGVLCNWLVCLAVWGAMAATASRGRAGYLLAHYRVCDHGI